MKKQARTISFAIIGALSVLLTSCEPPPPPLTQLEIRQFQTRTYETTDTKMVMKAMLNVLQDDAFIIKNAQLDLGLLSASKEMDIENSSMATFHALFSSPDNRWKKNQIIEMSGNVSEFGTTTKVRVNFQQKTLDNMGGTVNVSQILDPEFYQDFFIKVSKGIFIQEEQL